MAVLAMRSLHCSIERKIQVVGGRKWSETYVCELSSLARLIEGPPQSIGYVERLAYIR